MRELSGGSDRAFFCERCEDKHSGTQLCDRVGAISPVPCAGTGLWENFLGLIESVTMQSVHRYREDLYGECLEYWEVLPPKEMGVVVLYY